MSLKVLGQLKKRPENQKIKSFHRHIIVGSDIHAFLLFETLCKKYGEEELFLSIAAERLIMRFLIIFITFICANTYSKVEAPNYNFSLDQFSEIEPGKAFPPDEKKFGKPTFLEKRGDLELYRLRVAHIRYRFPVMVQVAQKKIVDFHATLPRYFLHDVFHQSLINRFGAQDKYFKIEENALYIWESKGDLKRVYSGTCTITCFPIYYNVAPKTPPEGVKGYRPLLESLLR
jgi:hypothetical protein